MKLAARVWTDHAHRMPCLHCEIPNLLQESMPPDPDLVDLIEQAFLELIWLICGCRVTEICIDALLVDEGKADQVWELWKAG